MKQYTVYKLVFPNGKMYVGTTSQFRARMRSHRFASLHGGTRPVQKALKKYGWDTIKVEIVAENITENKAYSLESELIALLDTKNNGYNCADGGKVNRGYTTGKAWNKGKRLSREHRQALIDAKAGKDYSVQAKQNSSRFPVVATSNVTGKSEVYQDAVDCAKAIGTAYTNVYKHIYRNSKLLKGEWTIRRHLVGKVG